MSIAAEAQAFASQMRVRTATYSQGETVDELKHNIRAAIAGVLEVLREQGRGPGTTFRSWM